MLNKLLYASSRTRDAFIRWGAACFLWDCGEMNHLLCLVCACKHTGADSHSECSSVSRPLPSDSRDTSPAPSTTRTHSHGDRDRHWDFERVERSDTSSVSSFEELDLDSDRCEHTPPALTGSGKNNLQGQDREMMVEEEWEGQWKEELWEMRI